MTLLCILLEGFRISSLKLLALQSYSPWICGLHGSEEFGLTTQTMLITHYYCKLPNKYISDLNSLRSESFYVKPQTRVSVLMIPVQRYWN